MKYRNAGVYAEKLKMTYCGVDCCKECRRIGDCGSCEADSSGEVDIADLAYFKQYVCKDTAVISKIKIGKQ